MKVGEWKSKIVECRHSKIHLLSQTNVSASRIVVTYKWRLVELKLGTSSLQGLRHPDVVKSLVRFTGRNQRIYIVDPANETRK
jgi:hypothetical protein